MHDHRRSHPDNMTALLDHAQQLHRAGQLDEAERIYNEILRLHAEQPDALLFLGLIANQRGDHPRAIELMSKAIGIQPEAPHYYCNLALVLTAQGSLREAIAAYRKAIQLKPAYPEASFNLGILLSGQGLLEEAVSAYEEVIRLTPGFDRAYSSMGNTLLDLGRIDSAIEHLRHALQLNPESAAAHFNLGNAYKRADKFEDAAAEYEQALKINPDFAEACSNLGNVLRDMGYQEEAFLYHRRAAYAAPGQKRFWQAFARVLQKHIPSQDQNLLEKDLEQCLIVEGIEHQGLARAALKVLRQSPIVGPYLDPRASDIGKELEGKLHSGDLLRALDRPLLLLLLEKTLVTDPSLEQFLTLLRRAFLAHTLSPESSARTTMPGLNFICALAHQCFRNEYVFFQTEEEQEQLKQLRARVDGTLSNGHETPLALIALLGCYQPLHQLPSRQLLLSGNQLATGGELFSRLIDRQIRELLEEETIRGQIHRLGAIEDDVSSKVRSQYEENPYPRWTSLYYQTPRPFNVNMRESYALIAEKNYSLPVSPEILIAGCGTGKHVIGTATRFLDVKVMAIDLSLTSLAYAVRKAREMDIKNVEFAQADILKLGNLDRRFDVIECGGVLHHLREPVRGWRILLGLLKPGGFMKLGLYSEIARRAVVAARQLIAESGIGSSPNEIRLFRKYIIELPEDAPAKTVMTRFNDFYSTSDCRDLLFHVQEHRFTLPQIAEILRDLGLEFIGFELGNSEKLADYRARFPEDARAVDLENWHQFELERPYTFTSMYQFWVRKS